MCLRYWQHLDEVFLNFYMKQMKCFVVSAMDFFQKITLT